MARKARQRKHNSLRIIGGRWRGRVIGFADRDGLRPTGDRVRETLFNWLQVQIPESSCLDLFAGSGALGFEALSRGAARVVMVEQSLEVVRALEAAASKLDAPDGLCIRAQSALDFIAENRRSFDVVFLDPPFQSDLHQLSIAALKRAEWFSSGVLVYVECPKGFDLKALLKPEWSILKDKTTGQVRFLLLQT